MDWVQLLSAAHSADECWEIFTDIINPGIAGFIPKVCRKKGNKAKIDPALKKLNAKKRCLWNLKRANPSKTLSDRYKLAAKALRSFILQKSITAEHDIMNSNDTNKFFKYVYQSRSHNSSFAPIMQISGDFATTDENKTNSLNVHFANVGTRDNGLLPDLSAETMITDGSLNLVYFAYDELYVLCKKQKEKNSSGPEGIPSLLYRNLAINLAGPLSMIFKLSMQFGTLPAV